MKTIKILFTLSLFTMTFYSCEPEELPKNNVPNVENISADTGDQKDVKETGED